MAVLSIFLDEAGNPPGADTDGTFVIGAIGITKEPEGTRTRGRLSPEAAMDLLRSWGADAVCVVVKPQAGYGATIDRKQELAKFMIAQNRRLGRAQKLFAQPDHVNYRNMVYQQALMVAVGTLQLATALVRNQAIEALQVFADRKTQGPGMPELAKMALSRAGEFGRDQLRQHNRKLRTPSSQRARKKDAEWMVAVAPDRTSIQWSNDPRFRGKRIALEVADAIASHARMGLMIGLRGLKFSQPLRSAGFEDAWISDVTNMIVRPPPLDMVREWELATGISVPYELKTFR